MQRSNITALATDRMADNSFQYTLGDPRRWLPMRSGMRCEEMCGARAAQALVAE